MGIFGEHLPGIDNEARRAAVAISKGVFETDPPVSPARAAKILAYGMLATPSKEVVERLISKTPKQLVQKRPDLFETRNNNPSHVRCFQIGYALGQEALGMVFALKSQEESSMLDMVSARYTSFRDNNPLATAYSEDRAMRLIDNAMRAALSRSVTLIEAAQKSNTFNLDPVTLARHQNPIVKSLQFMRVPVMENIPHNMIPAFAAGTTTVGFSTPILFDTHAISIHPDGSHELNPAFHDFATARTPQGFELLTDFARTTTSEDAPLIGCPISFGGTALGRDFHEWTAALMEVVS
jgi:hypothetical protein